MPKYKDSNNKVHELPDGVTPDMAIAGGCNFPANAILISTGEAITLIPPPTAAQLAAAEQAHKDTVDIQTAKAYTKLATLSNMTPAQVQAWVGANVTNLAQAQDAIATLAIAVSVLMRRL